MASVIAVENLEDRLREFWPGAVRWRVQMAEFTTLKVGGPAQALVLPVDMAEVVLLVNGCQSAKIPWCVVGGGSNLLVADEGVPGVVIVLGRDFADIRMSGKDRCGRTLVEVEAGCRLARLLNWCQDKGLAGLEFAVGIPGTVGGAVVMNAGAWGGEITDVLSSLTWLASGSVTSRVRAELDFGYRCWQRPADAVVLSATFAFTTEDSAKIGAVCRQHVAARRSKQPVAHGVAGSFFKNTEAVAAGKLIEDAGLKGTR
ncbi:MAG: UDP-N-acetylmuramate dehydrogenase, partial [Desulfobulbaceae bacterium]|nr:UDP-N-acetylmuramate dehydrogenase [Desulfobulbaceae bacterium]